MLKVSIKRVSLTLLIMQSIFFADVAAAHHSFAMFDREREELLAGTVVRWAFNSPHIALFIETDDGALYGFEGAAPAALVTRSPAMNGFTFQPGENVRVIKCPLRDGRDGGAIGFVITEDGTWYKPNDGACFPEQEIWEKWIAAGYSSKAEAEAGI
jgi:hypothetical protein